MDQHTKREWIAALLSGDYQQGVGFLQNGGKFCCLGVLAEVLGTERSIRPDREGVCYRCGDGAGDQDEWRNTIPGDQFGGLNDIVISDLCAMNDGVADYAGNAQTFEEIADWIDGNVY